ncbi:MAG: cytochrome c biogenesis protein CcsA, partial [Bdellovibrionales bacterium]|nr:cytochrome c biogenesis protein CcsA [Bdellovibrionales bacterium]
WSTTPFVQVRHSGLREALKLDADKTQVYYSPKELFENERVGLLIQEMRTKLQSQEKLNHYYQAVQNLENQLSLFHGIRLGQALRVAPKVMGPDWQSVLELEGNLKDRFEGITKAFVKVVSIDAEGKKTESQVSNRKEALSELEKAVADFEDLAKSIQPAVYGDNTKIMAEVHLNSFHPFMWAWIFYLIGALFLLGSMVNDRRWLYVGGWSGVVLGFCLHIYGMAIRSYILGRPPVSNMYESVVWVAWGAIIFSMVFELKNRTKTILMASSLVAVFCLLLTDIAPSVLDKSLQPLQPVLRDNFWLTTHVLIITLSYAAFFLAFALADLQLIYFLRDEKKYSKQIHEGTRSIYRAIQVGVVLLGGGIILGGVWADYSWGRFWGWDPKETWAFIAWVGYLAILHGRLVGWIRNFGMAVCSVVAFSLVIMAWYGVNFVLGAGLHSYGFGAGGVEYVAVFVALHLLWVVYVSTVRYSRAKAESPVQ